MGKQEQSYSVDLLYRAKMTIEVDASDYSEAHKKAYNIFMDSSPDDIFSQSSVKYSLVETSIKPDGNNKDGTDVLHD